MLQAQLGAYDGLNEAVKVDRVWPKVDHTIAAQSSQAGVVQHRIGGCRL